MVGVREQRMLCWTFHNISAVGVPTAAYTYLRFQDVCTFPFLNVSDPRIYKLCTASHRSFGTGSYLSLRINLRINLYFFCQYSAQYIGDRV